MIVIESSESKTTKRLRAELAGGIVTCHDKAEIRDFRILGGQTNDEKNRKFEDIDLK